MCTKSIGILNVKFYKGVFWKLFTNEREWIPLINSIDSHSI